MSEYKKEFKYFAVPEYEEEQEYLRMQHQKGWKLIKISGLCLYQFEKCEPEDVVYQLDYNQDGIAHKEEYVTMFQDCGWEYLFDFAGFSYFRKPVSQMHKDEEIFCDDSSRLDMIGRVFKGRMIPLLVIFFCIICPQLLMQSHLEGSISQGLMWMFVVMFVLYLILFIRFGVLYWKYYKKIHERE